MAAISERRISVLDGQSSSPFTMVDGIVVPRRHLVPESTPDEPSKVYSGIATSSQDLEQRLRLVTDRYLNTKYITPEVLGPNGLYKDEYEDRSLKFVSKVGGEVVASLRLIPNDGSDSGLPISSDDDILAGIYPEYYELVQNSPFEWSQLAKDKRYDKKPLFGLIRAAFAYTRSVRENSGVAVIDNGVRLLLNGSRTHFGLPQIGEGVFYMGSTSTPISINIDDVVRNSFEGGNRELAEFLDTGKAQGFNWYSGA